MTAGLLGRRLGRLQLLLRMEELAGKQSTRAHAEALARARDAVERLERVERALEGMAVSTGVQNVHRTAGGAHLRNLLGPALADARQGAEQCQAQSLSTAAILARCRDRGRQLTNHVEEARAALRRESEKSMIAALPNSRPRQ